MANGIGTIQVRRMKGKVTVVGMGKTPRGQSFIRSTATLGVEKMTDPDFKGQLAAAVKLLLS